MRRPLVLRSTDLVRLLVVVVLLGTFVAGASFRPAPSTAQGDEATPESAAPTSLVDVVLDPMPLAPSFVRLIRITMQPGSSIPMRSHPGPKIDRVESGTLTAVVRDEGNSAAVTIGGAAEAPVDAGQDVALATGDVIVLPIETFYAFRNDGDDPVVLLSTIMLPAGHQRPPGITYADGEPAADAYDGVTNQILGDGVATALPASPGQFMIDEVTVTPDQPLAGSSDVTLLSNTANGVDITIDIPEADWDLYPAGDMNVAVGDFVGITTAPVDRNDGKLVLAVERVYIRSVTSANAVQVGAKVYLHGNDLNTTAAGGTLFGRTLDAIGAGKTADVRVKLIG